MKKILALLLTALMLLSLCACESKVIGDFEAFVEETPYSCPVSAGETDEYPIDMDLVEQYQDWLDQLDEIDADAGNCEHYEYAEAVVSLAEYEYANEFLKCFYSTLDTMNAAVNYMSLFINALNDSDFDSAVSCLESAANKLDTVLEDASALDQDEEYVADYVACIRLLATNTADVAEALDDLQFDTIASGAGTISEQITIYADLMSTANTLKAEILAIEEEIEDSY